MQGRRFASERTNLTKTKPWSAARRRAINYLELYLVICEGVFMNFENSKDETLLRFYENVRDQVQADNQFGGKYRFAGDGVKQYADKLHDEMERRRLRFSPIHWHL
jgi:hypothetical protein